MIINQKQHNHHSNEHYITAVCKSTSFFLACSILTIFATLPALAADNNYTITLKDNAFTPSNLIIPANQKIKLVIKNQQSGPAEFESSELGREKVVGANSQITVVIGPLDAGQYHYVNDFHHETNGIITAK